MDTKEVFTECTLNSAQKLRFSTEFRSRLESMKNLPVLPESARALLKLRNNPNAGVGELVDIVERDPSIAMQLLSYARLSIFGYGDRVKDLNGAIQLVLGYQKALNIVLGLSAGQILKMEPGGLLGRNAFWQHSIYMGALTHALSLKVSPKIEVDGGIAYLAGLMHDIGFMLLGHLYPYEFSVLNQLATKHPEFETRELELRCLGLSHDNTGMWLMRAWNMPEELCVAVGEHYFPDYDGKHAVYSKLVDIANQLLKGRHGDFAYTERDTMKNIQYLGLSEEIILQVCDRVFEASSGLDSMARAMAA